MVKLVGMLQNHILELAWLQKLTNLVINQNLPRFKLHSVVLFIVFLQDPPSISA
jgi:hypothetical protein